MVRTRIAPSPTGTDLHIGNLYTALLNWAVARKGGGQFIVRIEDTDRTRYVPGAEEKILQTLAAFGLNNDEGPNVGGPHGPYRQSERLDLYKKHAHQLVEKGKAYFSFASKERLAEMKKEAEAVAKNGTTDPTLMVILNKAPDSMTKAKLVFRHMLRDQSIAEFTLAEGLKRAESCPETTIRLLVPDERESVTFDDLIRGTITTSTNQIDDQVLLKSDNYPTYHLAVVIDDYYMRITHVIRAEEWISSTPKHVLLYEAFDWPLPIFAHGPILRNPDRSKLSKRKNPVWSHWYLEQGYLPEAILNYLALMGWSHPQHKEIFHLTEFVEQFDLTNVSPVGPAFDPRKLEWMNGMYIRALTDEQLANRLNVFYHNTYPEDLLFKTVPLIKERIKTLAEYASYVEFFIHAPTAYEVDMTQYQDHMAKVRSILEAVNDWKAMSIGEAMQKLATVLGIKPKHYFQMVRVAITGRKISPPLNESMEILGQKECVARIRALQK